MKEIELSSAVRPLAEYANDLKKDEVLVVMKRRRPIAAVVGLRDLDRESVALSFHPKVRAIIEKSRADIAAGRTFSMDEVRQVVLGKRALRKRPRATTRKVVSRGRS